MDTYIIRVYRRDEDDHRPARGVVEKTGAVGQEVFSTMEELWKILSRGNRRSGARTRKKQG